MSDEIREGLMKIICKNRQDQDAISGNGLFSAEELFGIELNGGDDDFGEEMLKKRPGKGDF
jgi:hypothetical protein